MDDISTSTLFITLGLLVLFSAYFSGSETGIMSINRIRLRHLAKQDHRAAKRVSKLLSRPDRLIGLILIGNNLVNIAAAQVATIIGIRLYGDLGIAIATGVLTLVVLIFAEVTPKTLAALYPEKVAFPSSVILKGLLKIMFPFVVVVNWLTNGILRLFGISAAQIDEHSMSKEELLNKYVPHLSRINPNFDKTWIIDSFYHRENSAQPIIGPNYGKDIPTHRTPVRSLDLANTTQIYPEDRGTNYSVRIGRKVAQMIMIDNGLPIKSTLPIPAITDAMTLREE